MMSELRERLQVAVDDELLELSMTHRSYAYEHGGLPTNERLEFLGDSVLGIVITETLYEAFPELAEGSLAKLRAAVVNAKACAQVAREIGIGEYLRLGRGEETTGGRDKSSILADTLEAVIGAMYLSVGMSVAADFIHRYFDPLIDQAASLGAGLDWKTSLQELSAERGLGVPGYLIEESGPDHEKWFTAQVLLAGQGYGRGEGKSKKDAEQAAAAATYEQLAAHD